MGGIAQDVVQVYVHRVATRIGFRFGDRQQRFRQTICRDRASSCSISFDNIFSSPFGFSFERYALGPFLKAP
jgi:hypothetical protein